MDTESHAAQAAGAGAPRHLQPGDPLPDLILVTGRRKAADYAGRYLLILVGGADVLVDALAAIGGAAGRTTAVTLVAVASDGPWPAAADESGAEAGVERVVDVDGQTARRLGAVVGEEEALPLAVLVEPGGRVAVSITAESLVEAARQALAAIPASRARKAPQGA